MAASWLFLVFIIHVICPKQASSNVLIKRERHHRPGFASEGQVHDESDHLIHRKHHNADNYNYQPQKQSYSARNNDDVDDYFSAMMGDDDDDSDSDSDEGSESEGGVSDKSQLAAFGLSIMFGSFGAGRYYVGDYLGASFKLLLFLLVCCAPCCALTVGGGFAVIKAQLGNVFNVASSGGSEQISGAAANTLDSTVGCCATVTACLMSCATPALIVWYIVDVVLFAFNLIPDANGLPLNWKTVP